MICPLLENVLTCFDMNRKFLRVGSQSSAESREFEKWNQAAAPGGRAGAGGGQGQDPLLKCCDEQMCSHKVYLICDNNNFRVSSTPKVCTTSSM